jgi:hypothetical protein
MKKERRLQTNMDIEKSMLPPPLFGLGTDYALRDGIGGVTHAKTPSRKPP